MPYSIKGIKHKIGAMQTTRLVAFEGYGLRCASPARHLISPLQGASNCFTPEIIPIRFAIAIPPRTMTRMMATGVSHARRFVCSEDAPVMNGEA